MRSERSGQLLVIIGGLLAFTMLGWNGLLMPALIRDIERDLGITDADMGTAYLVSAATFTLGCLLTGWLVPKLGRRVVLLAGVALLVIGSAVSLLPSWPVFLGLAALRGLGSGVIEVGIQGLFLIAFIGPMQGRAINMVHFCYSLGAAIAPVALAGLLGAGLPWQGLMAVSSIPWLVSGVLLALAPMDGRTRAGTAPLPRLRVTIPLVAAAVAIALYVAAEVGVSSWLVRFLESADLGLAASALTLFWAALAASRLLASRFGHNFAPEHLAIGGFLVAAGAIVGAVVVPSVLLSIVLFGLAGFAFGPVYAGIILLAGRIPGNKDRITSIVASSGVAGSTVYPPLMGIISVGPGLGVAMAGAALLSVVGAVLAGVATRALPRREVAEDVAEPGA